MLAEPGISDKFLPFCSDRCRLIDLGRWLNEEQAISCEADEEQMDMDQDRVSSTTPRLPPGWHDA
jgi:endogenous inhibitor of DNA gyrase (YacG/DUF329 family)